MSVLIDGFLKCLVGLLELFADLVNLATLYAVVTRFARKVSEPLLAVWTLSTTWIVTAS